MYFDLNSEMKGLNEKTGDRLTITYKPKGWNKPSYLTGECKDKNGKTILSISGSWLDKIFITDANGIKELMWEMPTPFKECERQYNFSRYTILMNELTPQMKENGFLAPTDSRWRPDMQLHEQGKTTEADEAKIKLENI